MKRVLILSFSDLATDPRVARQIGLLSSRYDVTAAGFGQPRLAGARFLQLLPLQRSLAGRVLAVAMLKARAFERYYWTSPTVRYAHESLKDEAFDLVVANDLSALPLACRLKPAQGVIYDAHEYSPRELEDRFYWRFLFRDYNDFLCRAYLPSIRGMTTVCDSIAEEYRRNYGAAAEVVLSAPPLQALEPAAVSGPRIRMVHHGGAIPSRKIELTLEMMDLLDDRFGLDLMLVPTDAAYFRRLQAMVERRPRVRIVAPVPMQELPRRLNCYDIGLFLLPPTNFNYLNALPNKFFEFIQARLAVAIGPSPEMARLVRQFGCGVVSESFDPGSLAHELGKLDATRIDGMKQRSHAAARELCFERTAPVLLGMVDRLLEAA